jgi:nucleoside-triphosphatase
MTTADPQSPSTPAIAVLTGGYEAGKTRACLALVAAARAEGWRVGGVASPAVFSRGAKSAILVEDLRTGESRLLATKSERPGAGGIGYAFDESALAWADGLVAAAPPCDLLVVDELGPLELLQGRGLRSALTVLREGRYRLALVVVRPDLVEAFRREVPLLGALLTVEDLVQSGFDCARLLAGVTGRPANASA